MITESSEFWHLPPWFAAAPRTSPALLLLLTLWTVPARAEDTCRVDSVRVVEGGHPVADEGIAQVAAPPFAASLGTRLDLEVAVACGPSSTMVPKVACSWRIHGTPPRDPSCRPGASQLIAGETAWDGRRGRLHLSVPDTTGIYDLALACQVGDRSVEEIHRQLFVTWAEPLLVVSPPQRDWYEKAACWGGGWGTETTEAEILKAMLRGIWTYGGSHWRYGYATQLEENEYLFTGPGDSREILKTDEVMSCDGGSYCKCPWQSLVSNNSPCNFSDCYVFSNVLQQIAATLGIGGLFPCDKCTVLGETGTGFFAHREKSSLDPNFPGNILCDADSSCPRYFFGSHSLLRKDETYYDGTFNGIYRRPDSVIETSARLRNEQGIFVEDKLLFAYDDTQGSGNYGNWMFYVPPLEVPRLQGALRIMDQVVFRKIFLNENVIAMALEAEMKIAVPQDGIYTVHGLLRHEERVIAQRPEWWIPVSSSFTFIGKGGGTVTERLQFSGEEIYQAQQDGPWELAIFFSEQPESIRVPTPHFSFEEFGERDAWVQDPKIEWTGSEEWPVLRVSVQLAVRQPETFFLEMNLAKDGRTLANQGKKCVGWCREPLIFEVSARDLEASWTSGPYLLSLGLIQGRALEPVIGLWYPVPPPPSQPGPYTVPRSGDSVEQAQSRRRNP